MTLAGAHWERAVDLIEREWERMLRYDELRTLERWLQALPADRVRCRPQLSLALGVVRINGFRAAEAAKVPNEARFEPPGGGRLRIGRKADSGRVPTQWVDRTPGQKAPTSGGCWTRCAASLRGCRATMIRRLFSGVSPWSASTPTTLRGAARPCSSWAFSTPS